MIARLRGFGRDRRGAAAVEFAFVSIVLMGAGLMIFDGWTLASQYLDMRGGLKAGSRYYMTGGSSDVAARQVVLSSWSSRPQDAVVQVSRAYRCGQAAAISGQLCSDQRPPATYVQLTATTTAQGVLMQPRFVESQYVRVR